MTLTQLEIFRAVVERGSFTVAARRLGITQSGVSHAIASLESELGVPLIERSRSHFALTDIGETIHGRIQELLALARLIHQESAAARGLPQGSLRIGSFGASASLRLLPNLIAGFQSRYPGIAIHVEEGIDAEVLNWVHERRVDVGFVVLPNEDFDTVHIATDQLLVLLPQAHPLAGKTQLTPADLGKVPFIMTLGGSGPLVEALFAEAGVQPSIRFRIQQMSSILSLVRRGLGVSIVAELALPEDLTGVAAIPLKPRRTRDIGLALRSANPSLAARAFFDFAERLPRRQILAQG